MYCDSAKWLNKNNTCEERGNAPYGCGCAVSRSGTAQLRPIVNLKIDFVFLFLITFFLKF
jgi:hypothetical protein